MEPQHRIVLARLDDAIALTDAITHKNAYMLLSVLVHLAAKDACPSARCTYIRCADFIRSFIDSGWRFAPGSDRGWLHHLLSQRRERLLREWGE